jgi:hypothetical protein
MKKIFQNIAAYFLLLPILLLGIWLFLIGREALSSLLNMFYVGTSMTRGYQAGFADRLYVIFVGVGWMILFVVAEELLRRSAGKERLFVTFSRFMGAGFLLALVFDGILTFLAVEFAGVATSRWLVLGVELLFAALFIFLGWSKRSPFYRPKVIPGILES